MTTRERAEAVKAAATEIDAAIVAKGGTTAGGLKNARQGILSIPAGADVIPLEANSNGVYAAPEGTAYSPVTVNVPTEQKVSVVPFFGVDAPATAPRTSQYYARGSYAFASELAGGKISLSCWAKLRYTVNGGDYDGIVSMCGRNTSRGPMTLFCNNVSGAKAGLGVFVTGTTGGYAEAFVKGDYNDGKWHHIVGTYDAPNGDLKLYVDGQLAASASKVNAAFMREQGITVGNDGAHLARPFVGSVSEVSLWNRILTADEIASMFSEKSRLYGYESGLIGYWPCNDVTEAEAEASGVLVNKTSVGSSADLSYLATVSRKLDWVEDDGFPLADREIVYPTPWANDGWTHIWYHFDTDESAYATVNLTAVAPSGLTIYWGDGASDTYAGAETAKAFVAGHTYPKAGDYRIDIRGYTEITAYQNLVVNTYNYGTAYNVRQMEVAGATNAGTVVPNYAQGLCGFKSDCRGNFGNYTLSGFANLKSLELVYTADTKLPMWFVSFGISLEEIDITGVTETVSSSFSGCTNLKRVTMPDVNTLAVDTFKNCKSMRSVNMQNIKTLQSGAFASCYVSDLAKDGIFDLSSVETLEMQLMFRANDDTPVTIKFSNNLKSVTTYTYGGLLTVWQYAQSMTFEFRLTAAEWAQVTISGTNNQWLANSANNNQRDNAVRMIGLNHDDAKTAIGLWPFNVGAAWHYIFDDTPEGHYWTYANTSDKDGTYH